MAPTPFLDSLFASLSFPDVFSSDAPLPSDSPSSPLPSSTSVPPSSPPALPGSDANPPINFLLLLPLLLALLAVFALGIFLAVVLVRRKRVGAGPAGAVDPWGDEGVWGYEAVRSAAHDERERCGEGEGPPAYDCYERVGGADREKGRGA
ncbi:hypothetical protein EDC01DRAFT_784271 [Geopyxis carbonaria]|nr:hypothetical protein EDC01DRAFT_784271 [Geopyxis carbonaria]